MPVREGLIDPCLDVQGAESASNTRDLVDEQNQRGPIDGVAVTGNGGTDNITAPVSDVQTATFASASFAASILGKFIVITGATNAANNGTFYITDQTATNVSYVNPTGVLEANTSAVVEIYGAYCLEDDIAFTKTDRKNIKGTTNEWDDIPVYQRPTAIGTDVPANLTNIAGKTTDAKAIICDRKFENQAVSVGDTLVTVADTGNLPHADAIDRTGVPVQDGADAANLGSCYAEIVDPATNQALTVNGRAVGSIDCDSAAAAVTPVDSETVVLNDGVNPAVTFEFDTNGSVVESATLRQVDISAAADEDDVKAALISAINNAPTLDISASDGGAGIVSLINDTPGAAGNVAITETVASANFAVTGMSGGTANGGQRIYAFTQAGGSTDGDSVEVRFYSIPIGDPVTTANPYTWESTQPSTIDIFYPFRERLDLMDENCLRTTLVNGVVGDAGQAQDISEIRQAIGLSDGDTDLSTLLTNLTNFHPFSGLDSDPTVVEALNILNEQIGNRDYTGTILTDGQTVTASLQALSDAIGQASITRIIERLTAAIPRNTAHTIPGGNTYTLDPANNGINMYVYWRKLLRDPGPNTIQSNDYEETSTTSITPYQRIKAGDSINYFILA
jgi:hypothetical protein